ncbi:hypothetical protein QR680_011822 [Steinernema hermaphroditum]|uniref:RING-type domain-containing protein n=1 Tax=Steinernema hermaphroditum TaxID=289476 RepID=A0AA39I2C4_9BILA|nr:hypothetical protein QR680_011822 [Steinernema hermaphroditum]
MSSGPSHPSPAEDTFDFRQLGETVLGLTAQIRQKIYNAKLETHFASARYGVAKDKLSPSAYKKMMETTALNHPKCALCPHVDNRPVFELSCGHGCCRKCAQRTDSKRCQMCAAVVTVKAKILPRSKLLHDHKSKLDNHARLALVNNLEYADKLHSILLRLNTCIECGIMKKCQRVLSACGHVMCQHCIEKLATYRTVFGFRILAKPTIEISCPDCSVRSTVATGDFASDPVSRSLYVQETIQKMFHTNRIENPIASVQVRQTTYCSSCKQEQASNLQMCECKTCNLETPICMKCANDHDDRCHVITVIAEGKDRGFGLENLSRLYLCADQYVLGILTRFEEDFHHSQTHSLVDRIVANRDGIATIYEGIAEAQYVTPLIAKKAVKKAEVYLKRLRMITDVITQDWPRLRSIAKQKVDDVLEIPSEDEEEEEEERKDEAKQPTLADAVKEDDMNRSTEIISRVEDILAADLSDALSSERDAFSPLGSDYEVLDDQ